MNPQYKLNYDQHITAKILSFEDLDLKFSYDSDHDDILNDFYIPVLSNAVSYRRLAGFFSSTSLAVAARGLSGFIAKGGKMKLVVGARLRRSDVDAIIRGYDLKQSITKSFIKDIESIEDELIRDHVKALAWMVANNNLDIKIAIPTDKDGNPFDEETIQQRGIFHQKIGILEDKTGNAISFSGSVNETATGWLHNVEEFKVFRSWIDGEVQYLRSDFDKFERYWYSNANNVIITDIPVAVKNKFVDLAPDDFERIRDRIDRPSLSKGFKLRRYQKECVENWLRTGKGIIEMATGTGKTFTAIGCFTELQKKESRLFAIVACPYIHLINQWADNFSKWGYDSANISGSVNSWENNLMNLVYDSNNGYRNHVVVITTHDTLSSSKFIDIAEQLRIPTLLIADEVHGMGAPERSKGLLSTYKYRIGLSATPVRQYDEEGTDILFNYFGDVIFRFPIKDAIPEFLTPYEYHPYIVELTHEEFEEYRTQTKRIARQYFSQKNKEMNEKGLELLLIQRQRIIVNARNKIEEFKRILDTLGSVHDCLVYCSPNQIHEIQEILNTRGIIQHKFTAEEDMTERRVILDSFASGSYQVLVAMKCLDEGVDVPSTRTAIMLASSTNPREFIQRRGRILRRYPGKEKAILHDIIVVPSYISNLDQDVLSIEKKIIQKELRRIREFSTNSLNPLETINKLYPILQKYGMGLEDFEQRDQA